MSLSCGLLAVKISGWCYSETEDQNICQVLQSGLEQWESLMPHLSLISSWNIHYANPLIISNYNYQTQHKQILRNQTENGLTRPSYPSLPQLSYPIFMYFLSRADHSQWRSYNVCLSTSTAMSNTLTYLVKDPLNRDLHFLIFTLFKCIKLTDRVWNKNLIHCEAGLGESDVQ